MPTSHFLTKDEVLGFLADKLNIHLTGPDECRPTMELLQRVCSAHSHAIPFTTVHLYNIPIGERRVETHEEIKQLGLLGVGGLCYSTNVFLHWILAGLGFKVHFQGTRFFNAPDYDHLLNIVHLEDDGKRYLIDGSCNTFVSELPLCLDFDGAISPTSLQTMYDVRVVRQVVDNQADRFVLEFCWKNGAGVHPMAKVSADGWVQAMDFSLNYRSLEELPEVLQLVRGQYRDVTAVPILGCLLSRRFKAGKVLLIRGMMLTLQCEDRKRIHVPIKSRRQWLSVMAEHFGDVISMEDLQRAIDNYIRLTAPTEMPDGFCEI
ncbi:hypothetical protein BV898_08677 [Hypsibius exemplaris]|uniref:arylamine N-acetyltransferase n=1 Tax=Hypsibius exemplaris TaxID=2072580 RepID=A0A1W0WQ17_HYPEX|nr:hypothetical protein BV898_08677 [Hypsibius exemplaris]